MYSFVNNVENWLSIDIEYIDNNKLIKLNIVAEVKFKSAGRFAVLLAVGIKFSEIFKSLAVYIIAGAF